MMVKFMSLMTTVTAAVVQAVDIPDPPLCIFDCGLFEEVTQGKVDDCAVMSSWTASDCMNDCSADDISIYEVLKESFCVDEFVISRALNDGSFGSFGSFGSYSSSGDVPTPAPTATPTRDPTPTPVTCVDALLDIENICNDIGDAVKDVGLPCGELFTAFEIPTEAGDYYAALCPVTCSDFYEETECVCTPELYTCSNQEAPPCSDDYFPVDQGGPEVCATIADQMKSYGFATCTDFSIAAVASQEGGRYEDFAMTLQMLAAYCPITCGTCDGYYIPTEDEVGKAFIASCEDCDNFNAELCFSTGEFDDTESSCNGLELCEPCYAQLPMVIELQVGLTFAEELEDDEVGSVETAIQVGFAADRGLPAEYVGVAMFVESARSFRRLLAVNYVVIITITIPAQESSDYAEMATVGAEDVQDVQEAIEAIGYLAEVNDGVAPSATVQTISYTDVDDQADGTIEIDSSTSSPTPAPKLTPAPTSASASASPTAAPTPVATTPSSANKLSSSLGLLLASFICVLHTL